MDTKGPNLVKGIHMEGLRVLGTSERFADYYYKNGADELFYQDVVASLYQRNSLLKLVEKTASAISIPLTVGGGIKSLDDISKLLDSGADKVSLNTSVIKDPKLIDRAAKKFGSSTIIIAIEHLKNEEGQHLAFTDNGREHTGIDIFKWSKEIEDRGAGEILLTSIDNDGTGEGFEIDTISKICESLSIPVIAHGGAGKSQDVVNVINKAGADAVAIASLIHYNSLSKLKKKNTNFEEGNTEFINKKTKYKKFENTSINLLKKKLLRNGISTRI